MEEVRVRIRDALMPKSAPIKPGAVAWQTHVIERAGPARRPFLRRRYRWRFLAQLRLHVKLQFEKVLSNALSSRDLTVAKMPRIIYIGSEATKHEAHHPGFHFLDIP